MNMLTHYGYAAAADFVTFSGIEANGGFPFPFQF